MILLNEIIFILLNLLFLIFEYVHLLINIFRFSFNRKSSKNIEL